VNVTSVVSGFVNVTWMVIVSPTCASWVFQLAVITESAMAGSVDNTPNVGATVMSITNRIRLINMIFSFLQDVLQRMPTRR
jgi:hypothetical protein